MMNMRLIGGMFGAAALVVTTAAATPNPAAPNVRPVIDARWTAWLGCWRPEAVDGLAPPSHLICVLPTESGVSIATIVEGSIASEQPIVADGSRRAVDESGCKGYETATWSQDGRRVFLKSDLNCGPDAQRTSSGVLALVSPAAYVDVQTVTVAGQQATRTVRYVALMDNEIPTVVMNRLKNEPMARETARIRASSPLDIEDVVEASRVIGSAGTEGLLVARRTGFELNGNKLRELTAAGVKPSTVDVMVALTYPDHFEVAEEAPRAAGNRGVWGGDRVGTTIGSSRASCYARITDDPYYDRYGYGYDPYNYRYSRCGYNSFYSPYGYDSYGWGYGTGPVVVLQPSERVDEVKGTAVKGKGYTRRGTSSGTTTTATARPKNPPATTTAAPASAKGSATSGGASSSGSGTSTGRTAKPKNGGGGI